MPTLPSFGDHVRIEPTKETRQSGFASRIGQVYGVSVPSLSGAGPVIGDRGEDCALYVHFDDTSEDVLFAPHLLTVVDHAAGMRMVFEGGPSLVRDTDGTWHEIEGEFAVTKEYREDLGEQDEDGFYDYAYYYWDYTFVIDGHTYLARIYTDTPEKASIRKRTPPPEYERDLLAISDYLRREAGVTTILTLGREGYEPWPHDDR